MVANVVIAQLLFLQKENKTQDINLYINSPGGSVTAGLAIYDTMQFVQCDGRDLLHRSGSSMGALLSRLGNARASASCLAQQLAYHDPSALGRRSRAPRRTSRIHADEIAEAQEDDERDPRASHTGKPPETIEKTPTATIFMSAQEAKDYGLVDEVIDSESARRKPEACSVHWHLRGLSCAGLGDLRPAMSDLWRRTATAKRHREVLLL
jgi:ATP-dependent Clp protease protease subunit